MAGRALPGRRDADDTSSATREPLARGRRALSEGRWSDADAHFRDAAETGNHPAAWEGVADAAWWLDDAVRCLEARERAYRGHRDGGDDLAAARDAATLGYDAALFGQGLSVASGWLGRARRLVRGHEDTATAGWVAAREAELALNVTHDSGPALGPARRARDLGSRHGDGDLEVVGEALEGLALAMTGQVADGLARLDAAAAAALAGDVGNVMWVGKIWCWLIGVSAETHDLGRAAQWCERVEELSRARDLAPLANACRTRHASVQVSRGNWLAAETELLEVLDPPACLPPGHPRRRRRAAR